MNGGELTRTPVRCYPRCVIENARLSAVLTADKLAGNRGGGCKKTIQLNELKPRFESSCGESKLNLGAPHALAQVLQNICNQLHTGAVMFFERVGRLALGSRVRFLAEAITRDAAQIFEAYGTELQPKWFPVYYVLTERSRLSITVIAEDIGHSHVSVSKIVAEMSRAGLVIESTDSGDRRRTVVSLSRRGRSLARRMRTQYADVTGAVEEISAGCRHDLWQALGEWEAQLQERSLLQRVIDHRRQREFGGIRIEPYRAGFRSAFRRLNEAWIKAHFKMEPPDFAALDDPQRYILARGGFIFVATLRGRAVGVCALLKRDDSRYPYELAKMAVAPRVRGRGVGYLLGLACADKARELGIERLYLESNTVLAPAIRLYEKLGFRRVTGVASPYERCNIQMELSLRRLAITRYGSRKKRV